ncbi:PP0621 family protein [Solemya elarraichensis gill symbiont]|uniref:Uncharacterized protein n=1 Tax=Solemya elarraichensis gill symbiont TaxID=1918949 RepID=A0A1T2LD55_9GAMM|nr:PP0621 family protein [Solemya elarraichensis gill symbiont]OOZ43011.1 hypothetical protein BOW52_00495 [Solemya elarraichensis gill symbiont]
MKILILAAIFGLAVLFIRSWLRLLQFKTPEQPGKEKKAQMVACEKCGLHVPLEMSFEVDGKYYCCREHAEKK